MAVRKLAQAVVEGGRSRGSKEARRRLARWHRRRVLDGDGEPARRKAAPIRSREFADRLSVLWRWLESRIVGSGNDRTIEITIPNHED